MNWLETDRKRLVDRLYRNTVIKDNGCREWTCYVNKTGYANLNISSSRKPVYYLAHRLSYELFVGEIATGMTIDHLCKNRRCIETSHLEVVTLEENVRRGDHIKNNPRLRKTHCPQRHSYSGDNLRILKSNGWRYCIKCQNERNKNRRVLSTG